jgi:hypothetical protein
VHEGDPGSHQQPAGSRPEFTPRTASLLKHMFRTGQAEPWQNRDSRWLHSAWQLVVENLSNPICAEIQAGFLSEFETRVSEAASRNQGRFRENWHAADQGLLQLVPDDVLLQLGVLPTHTPDGRPTLQTLQQWPSPGTGPYEKRRDRFNNDLQQLKANYCLCPPQNWEHPKRAKNGTPRDSRECRVTVTNLQFEAFDPLHRRFRRWEWYRPEMEAEQQKLDDHPAVEIMPYQADMLAIWCQ